MKEMGPRERQLREMREARLAKAEATARQELRKVQDRVARVAASDIDRVTARRNGKQKLKKNRRAS